MRLCVYEDSGVDFLEPLALTRPAFDLRIGAGLLLDRQRRHFGNPETGLGIIAAVALIWLVPDRRIESRLETRHVEGS